MAFGEAFACTQLVPTIFPIDMSLFKKWSNVNRILAIYQLFKIIVYVTNFKLFAIALLVQYFLLSNL